MGELIKKNVNPKILGLLAKDSPHLIHCNGTWVTELQKSPLHKCSFYLDCKAQEGHTHTHTHTHTHARLEHCRSKEMFLFGNTSGTESTEDTELEKCVWFSLNPKQ